MTTPTTQPETVNPPGDRWGVLTGLNCTLTSPTPGEWVLRAENGLLVAEYTADDEETALRWAVDDAREFCEHGDAR